MANRIYLNGMKGTKLQKVGFSGNWCDRRKLYVTHNPLIEFKEYAITYAKTKHRLEKECQREIEEMGGKFLVVDGIKTEWFELDREISLADLKCCKGRKIYTFKNETLKTYKVAKDKKKTKTQMLLEW